MRRSIARKRAALFTLLAVLSFGLTGCQMITQLIGSLMGGGGIGGGFNGGGGLGGLGGGGSLGGGLPGLLNGTGIGNGGPLAPNNSLPAPAASQASIQQVTQRYGLQITGSGAAGQPLQKVIEGLQHYPDEKVRGIGRIHMPAVGNQGLLGTWETSGGPALITYYVQGGRRNALSNNTVIHEVGHHATLWHRQFGRQLVQAIGVHPAMYPSEYSKTDGNDPMKSDLLAETLAFALLGNRAEERVLPNWRLTQAASQLIQSELIAKRSGGSPGTGATGTGTGATGATGTTQTGATSTSAPRPTS